MRAMTKNMKRFCDAYLVDLNGTNAYRAAYPNIKNDQTAGAAAARMLKDVRVQEYLKIRQDARMKRLEMKQDDVLLELYKIVRAQVTDFASINNGAVFIKATGNLTEDQKTAIASIKEGANGVELKLHDKMKALELIGRHLGMFNDKLIDLKIDEIKITIGDEEY